MELSIFSREEICQKRTKIRFELYTWRFKVIPHSNWVNIVHVLVHRFINCQNSLMSTLVLHPPPPPLLNKCFIFGCWMVAVTWQRMICLVPVKCILNLRKILKSYFVKYFGSIVALCKHVIIVRMTLFCPWSFGIQCVWIWQQQC